MSSNLISLMNNDKKLKINMWKKEYFTEWNTIQIKPKIKLCICTIIFEKTFFIWTPTSERYKNGGTGETGFQKVICPTERLWIPRVKECCPTTANQKNLQKQYELLQRRCDVIHFFWAGKAFANIYSFATLSIITYNII